MGQYQVGKCMHYESPKGEERKKDEEGLFKEIMAENFPKPMKEINREPKGQQIG